MEMHAQPWVFAIRSAIVMMVLFALFRLMGKRQAAQMNIYDLAMIMAMANAVQNAMTGGRGELAVGLACSTAVVLVAWALTRLFVAAPSLEERLVGKPTILLNDGVVLQDRLRRERVTVDELMATLRGHGLTRPTEARLAVLELDGTISVVPKDPYP